MQMCGSVFITPINAATASGVPAAAAAAAACAYALAVPAPHTGAVKYDGRRGELLDQLLWGCMGMRQLATVVALSVIMPPAAATLLIDTTATSTVMTLEQAVRARDIVQRLAEQSGLQPCIQDTRASLRAL